MRVSNCLDPDQDRRFVGPDLGPYCLQSLSADQKVATSKERLNSQLMEDDMWIIRINCDKVLKNTY